MSFPYASYAEYVGALAEADPRFGYLHTFLTDQNDIGDHAPLYVCDLIQGKIVKQRFTLSSPEDLHLPQRTIENRPSDSRLRMVLFAHDRVGSSSEKPSKKMLDFIGCRYRLQPDMLRLHYFDPWTSSSRPAAQELVIQRPLRKPCMLRLQGPRNYMLSAQLCQDGTFQNSTTLFVIVSGLDMYNLNPHLDGDFSLASYQCGYVREIVWSWEALDRLDAEAIESAALHPNDLAIPFAQLFAQRLVVVIESVGQRIMGDPDTGSRHIRLGEAYYDYLKYLEHLRNACASLKQFGGESPSERFKALLENYQEIFNAYDWKLGGINQLVNYRATTASLQAAEASLEESRRGIEQNNKVKKLTQLAFVFIPLSFVTGAFGMNLNVLDTGSATIWQVVVGTLVVYALVAMIWGLQVLFEKMKPKFVERRKRQQETEENWKRTLMRQGPPEEAMRRRNGV